MELVDVCWPEGWNKDRCSHRCRLSLNASQTQRRGKSLWMLGLLNGSDLVFSGQSEKEEENRGPDSLKVEIFFPRGSCDICVREPNYSN